MLGETAPHNRTPLDEYSGQVFGCFVGLAGVDRDYLLDLMTCDWLSMVKGKNMPHFLKLQEMKHKQLATIAKERLGHVVSRQETAVLRSGIGVFVDSENRDPVTGLYKVYSY